MMLAWSPPLVMMPCTRASGLICWRIWSSETKSWIMALRALTPRHGQDEACEAFPKKSHLTLTMPRLGRQTCVPQRPWIIMAASTPLKTPASMSLTLPAPPSSAGRADHLHATREGNLAQRRRDGRARARAGGGDDVVATGMPDVRQGIVLRHDGHRGPGARALDGRPEGRGQAAHTPLDPRPLLLEEAREPRRGLFLLEAQLGIGVDLKRELFQLVGQAIDGVRDLGLGLVERVSGHGRTPPWRPSHVRGRPAGHRSSWPWSWRPRPNLAARAASRRPRRSRACGWPCPRERSRSWAGWSAGPD